MNAFFHVGWFLKLVICLLLVGSIVSWAIACQKFMALRVRKKEADFFEQFLWNSSKQIFNPEEALRRDSIQKGAFFELFTLLSGEYKSCGSLSLSKGLALSEVFIERCRIDLDDGVSLLATIASISPFVGLFGTVLGIIHSFSALGSHADLQSVAPGLSEALFLTALGLFVAIPANIFFNKISADTELYARRMSLFSQEIGLIFSAEK